MRLWLDASPEHRQVLLEAPVLPETNDGACRSRSTNFGNFVADVISGRLRKRNSKFRDQGNFIQISGLDAEVPDGSLRIQVDLSALGSRLKFTFSYAAVAQAVERAKRRIAQSAATRKLYHGVAATFKLKT